MYSAFLINIFLYMYFHIFATRINLIKGGFCIFVLFLLFSLSEIYFIVARTQHGSILLTTF